MKFTLPSKLPSHLRRIAFEYKRGGNSIELCVAEMARVYVEEETDFDNWNGGTYGHDIVFYMDEFFFRDNSLASQREAAERIRKDLNDVSDGIDNEYWRKISIELSDDTNPQFKLAKPPQVRRFSGTAATSVWGSADRIKLFISHRDIHKRKVSELAKSLDNFGITSFVAHDTIEATKEWRNEIVAGLETMDAMLVFLTDDFHESSFTNQEIGYALGRNVPVVSLKLQSKDPPGFISHEQAERGRIDNVDASAAGIAKLIYRRLGKEGQLRSTLINSFCEAKNFNETIEKFNIMKSSIPELQIEDVDKIIESFNGNDQLHKCGYLNTNKRLLKYINESSAIQVRLQDGRLGKEVSVKKLDEIPDIPF